MDIIDYKRLTREEIIRQVSEMTPHQLVHSLPQLSRSQVEAAASVMTMPQFIAAVDFLGFDLQHADLFLPLLKGVPHSLLMQFLTNTSGPVLERFKQEAGSEVIQHQINTWIHDLTEQLAQQESLAEEVHKAIERLDIHQFDIERVDWILDSLATIARECASLIDGITRPLELAWNTGRADLVDKLSYLKEHALHLLIDYVGKRQSANGHPSGLHVLIEDKLNALYDAINGNADSALTDGEPAIEGLAKLGLWYLEDYWEYGLLPSIIDRNALHLGSHHTEKERLDYKAYLMELVRQNLTKIGFGTVADLKRARIYSPLSLKKYIGDHQYLLGINLRS
jgi:hypothetical protein